MRAQLVRTAASNYRRETEVRISEYLLYPHETDFWIDAIWYDQRTFTAYRRPTNAELNRYVRLAGPYLMGPVVVHSDDHAPTVVLPYGTTIPHPDLVPMLPARDLTLFASQARMYNGFYFEGETLKVLDGKLWGYPEHDRRWSRTYQVYADRFRQCFGAPPLVGWDGLELAVQNENHVLLFRVTDAKYKRSREGEECVTLSRFRQTADLLERRDVAKEESTMSVLELAKVACQLTFGVRKPRCHVEEMYQMLIHRTPAMHLLNLPKHLRTIDLRIPHACVARLLEMHSRPPSTTKPANIEPKPASKPPVRYESSLVRATRLEKIRQDKKLKKAKDREEAIKAIRALPPIPPLKPIPRPEPVAQPILVAPPLASSTEDFRSLSPSSAISRSDAIAEVGENNSVRTLGELEDTKITWPKPDFESLRKVEKVAKKLEPPLNASTVAEISPSLAQLVRELDSSMFYDACESLEEIKNFSYIDREIALIESSARAHFPKNYAEAEPAEPERVPVAGALAEQKDVSGEAKSVPEAKSVAESLSRRSTATGSVGSQSAQIASAAEAQDSTAKLQQEGPPGLEDASFEDQTKTQMSEHVVEVSKQLMLLHEFVESMQAIIAEKNRHRRQQSRSAQQTPRSTTAQPSPTAPELAEPLSTAEQRSNHSTAEPQTAEASAAKVLVADGTEKPGDRPARIAGRDPNHRNLTECPWWDNLVGNEVPRQKTEAIRDWLETKSDEDNNTEETLPAQKVEESETAEEETFYSPDEFILPPNQYTRTPITFTPCERFAAMVVKFIFHATKRTKLAAEILMHGADVVRCKNNWRYC